jgi:hypothetical protein
LIGTLLAAAVSAQHGVAPPRSRPEGHSYAQWSVRWWQWYLSLPVAGHPGTVDPTTPFDVREGQHGEVWFLAGALNFLSSPPTGPLPPTILRTCTIPAGTSLFVAILDSEWSDLEGYPTEQDQRDTAVFFANHDINQYFTVDGVPVQNINSFRFSTPQFSFWAPNPWINSPSPSGIGHAVADGYYVFLNPLPVGHHVIHYGGFIHVSVAEGDPFDLDAVLDMTYDVTVVPHRR